MWFQNIIRDFFGFLDSIIYGFVNTEYVMFINISQLTLLNNESFEAFATRIYTLIGIFMLFKIAFSLLEMLVNPEVITDKSKGIGKIVQRTVISLLLIVLVPTIFNYAFKIQSVVLGQNILANIILGGGYNTNLTEDDEKDQLTKMQEVYANGGKLMGFSVLSAFMSPAKEDLIKQYENEAEAKAALGDLYEEAYLPYQEALLENDIDKLLDLKNVSEDGDYVFDYNYFLSTLAGGFIAWVMLTFCIDVGVRMVKLTFLQLIAPIPVLSYIDPKTNKVFNSWVKECVKTYLDVFLRLLIIYFVIFILSIVAKNGLFSVYRYEWNFETGELLPREYSTNLVEKALIICGLLLFAKQAPGLISDMLGIKLSGDFTLNPISKIQSVPLIGKGVTDLSGRAAGGITAMKNDPTGMPIASFLQGWNHAGKQLKGKVAFAGNKPGQAPINPFSIGRDAGYELVGGDKDKVYNPMAQLNRKKAEKNIEELKEKYKYPLQNKINALDMQLSSYQKQYQEAEAAGDKAKAKEIYDQWEIVNKQKFDAQKHLSNIDSQIDDIKKRYHVDDSTNQKISDAKDWVTNVMPSVGNFNSNENNKSDLPEGFTGEAISKGASNPKDTAFADFTDKEWDDYVTGVHGLNNNNNNNNRNM